MQVDAEIILKIATILVLEKGRLLVGVVSVYQVQ